MGKDWFDKHVVVMTLDDDKKKEKKIKCKALWILS
jgi:hypothetical protein